MTAGDPDHTGHDTSGDQDTPTDQDTPAQGEDYGGPKGYPPDPGSAYDTEPEPAEKSFSEPIIGPTAVSATANDASPQRGQGG